jgi:hypothetical protein
MGRGVAAAKAAPAPKVKKEAGQASREKATFKSCVKGVIGSKGAAADVKAANKALLDLYEGLARFDEEKQALLELWAKDKSCTWIHTYIKSRTVSKSKTSEGASGYCTKSANKFVIKHKNNIKHTTLCFQLIL